MGLVDNDGAIELTGRLDGRSSAEVRDRLYDHIERHPDEDVRVDVTRVESIDVTALNLLAAAAVKVRRAGGTVVLVGCSPALRRVLSYRGWRRLFRLERAGTDDVDATAGAGAPDGEDAAERS